METGPKLIKFSPRSHFIAEIAEQIGEYDNIIFGQTKDSEIMVMQDGKLRRLFTSKPFSMLKFIFSDRAIFRTVIINLFRRRKFDQGIEDMSVYDFLQNFLKYYNEDDQKYIIELYGESQQIESYAGNIKELSARSCPPYGLMFNRLILKPPREKLSFTYAKFPQFLKIMKENRYGCFTFKDGLGDFMGK